MLTPACLLVLVFACAGGHVVEQTQEGTEMFQAFLANMDQNDPLHHVFRAMVAEGDVEEIIPTFIEALRTGLLNHTCKCENNACECCVFAKVGNGKYKGCFEIAHKGSSIDVTVDVMGHTVFTKAFPAEYTKCGYKRVLFWTITVCARIHNIRFLQKGISACVGVSRPINFEFVCFKVELVGLHGPTDTTWSFEVEQIGNEEEEKNKYPIS